MKRPLPSVRSAVLRFQAAVTAVSRPQGVVVIAPTLGSHIETAADPTFHFAGQKITLLGMAMGAGLHPGRHLLLHQLEILFVDERGNRLLDDDPFLPRLLLVAVALAVHILRRGTVINVGANILLAFQDGIEGILAEGAALFGMALQTVEFVHDFTVAVSLQRPLEDQADDFGFPLVDDQRFGLRVEVIPQRRDTAGMDAFQGVFMEPLLYLSHREYFDIPSRTLSMMMLSGLSSRCSITEKSWIPACLSCRL